MLAVTAIAALYPLNCVSAEPETYDPAKATGVIKGVANFLGDIPVMPKIDVPDSEVRAFRKDKEMPVLKKEDVIVSDDRKIANLIVFVSKGQEKYSFYEIKKTPARIVSIGAQYFPHVLCIMTGQEMEIENHDRVAHNWHILSDFNGELNMSQPMPGVLQKKPSFSTRENGISVKCDVHGWTRGKICVFDHPFFAVTKADGSFEIKLPPGDYELSFWHEYPRKVVVPEPMKVTVAADKPTEINVAAKNVDYHPNRLTEEEKE